MFAAETGGNPLGARCEMRAEDELAKGLSSWPDGTVAVSESVGGEGVVGAGSGRLMDFVLGTVDESGSDLGPAGTKEGETTKRT